MSASLEIPLKLTSNRGGRSLTQQFTMWIRYIMYVGRYYYVLCRRVIRGVVSGMVSTVLTIPLFDLFYWCNNFSDSLNMPEVGMQKNVFLKRFDFININ